MYTPDDILTQLHNVTDHNGYYTATCPCHPDRGAALTLTVRDGNPVALCSVCGALISDILAAIQGHAPVDPDDLTAWIRPLSAIPMETASWVIDGWIPSGQITLLAADGGIGKSTVWCHIVSALTTGSPCILDNTDHHREPQKIAILSAEDDLGKILKQRIDAAGGDQSKIITIDLLDDTTGKLRNLKIGSKMMAQYIRHVSPTLCVLDPIQGFLPRGVNMSRRNDMRDCLSQLLALGKETGCAFLLVCHTNKRKDAAGRNRISDSADIWDIARSVIMMGNANNHQIYIANEKNNYGPRKDTILVTIDDGKIVYGGTTSMHDIDFVRGANMQNIMSKSDSCKAYILDALRSAPNLCMRSEALIADAAQHSISAGTLNRVRSRMVKDGLIRLVQRTDNGNKVWFAQLCEDDAPTQTNQPHVNEDTPSHIDQPDHIIV